MIKHSTAGLLFFEGGRELRIVACDVSRTNALVHIIFFIVAVGLLAAVTGIPRSHIDLYGRARRNIRHVDIARHAKWPKRRQAAGRRF